MDSRQQVNQLRERVCASIIGQEDIVDRLIIGLLANGNLLIEGLPGLAKTRAVKSLAKNLAADFSRIQFTPDLLPADITGTEVLHTTDAGHEFRFDPGPIFANIVLADEINRAPAKVQAALLEAMEERQVTVAGTTHKMPPLFTVMATQNPVEQEGTYPLPEAQIIRLVRGEEHPEQNKIAGEDNTSPARPEPIPQEAVFAARNEISAVTVSDIVERYMVDIIFATRYPERYNEDLRRWIQIGASPRGALALDRCARAKAWLAGRDHVLPEDVRDMTHDCLRHRLTLSYEASADGLSANNVIDQLLDQVAVA